MTAGHTPNLILIGMPGSGKSTIGVLLAKRLGMDFVDTDVLIQVREGRTLQEILDRDGYEALRAVEERVLMELDVHGAVIATGGSAVYSGRAMRRLMDHGVIVFLDVPLLDLKSRVGDLATRGIAAPKGTTLAQLFEQRHNLYLISCDVQVECGDMGMEAVADRVVKESAKEQALRVTGPKARAHATRARAMHVSTGRARHHEEGAMCRIVAVLAAMAFLALSGCTPKEVVKPVPGRAYADSLRAALFPDTSKGTVTAIALDSQCEETPEQLRQRADSVEWAIKDRVARESVPVRTGTGVEESGGDRPLTELSPGYTQPPDPARDELGKRIQKIDEQERAERAKTFGTASPSSPGDDKKQQILEQIRKLEEEPKAAERLRMQAGSIRPSGKVDEPGLLPPSAAGKLSPSKTEPGRAPARVVLDAPPSGSGGTGDEPQAVYILDAGAGTKVTERPSMAGEVKAGSHDDNEEFPFYQRFCEENSSLRVSTGWDVGTRWVVRVVDPDSNAVPFAKVSITGKDGGRAFTALTPMAGEVMVFPAMDLDDYLRPEDFRIAVDRGKAEKVSPALDGRVTVVTKSRRDVPGRVPVQICFLIDATGSMRDEIEQLRDVIFSIHQRIVSHPIAPDVEFALVAYRDRKDDFVVKGYPFTSVIDTFQLRLEKLEAKGGYDYPEDIDSGFRYVLDSLSWKEKAAKFVFLVGDAPPHLDYGTERTYTWAMRTARERAIMVVPIGASGLKPLGEYIFRQIGVTTRGPFVFLHYGEQGESEGTATVEDPGKVSHHTGSNYAVRRLDDIVVDIVLRELGYVTPVAKIVRTVPRPEDEKDHLDTRMENLLLQVVRGDSPAGKKVVVAPVQCRDSTLRPLGEYLWAVAIEKVSRVAPSLTVIERARLEDVLREHALDLSGVTERSGEAEIGRILSTDYIIFCGLGYLGAVRVCDMRMVNCASGGLMGAGRIRL